MRLENRLPACFLAAVAAFSAHALEVSVGPGEDATRRIQESIDKVWGAGGGRVSIKAGSYEVKGMRLRSGVELHLEAGATLLASRDPADYFILAADRLEPLPQAELEDIPFVSPVNRPDDPLRFLSVAGSRWNNAIIRAYGARDVAVTGEPGSVIDGRNGYDPKGEEGYRGVHGFSFFHCTNVLFRGYTVRHSGNWHHRLEKCVRVRCEKVTALGGHDGFHARSSDDLVISDCRFHTGDDSIAGQDNVNVRISRCDLSSACSAIRFGGRNVLIEDCTAAGPCEYVFRGLVPPQAKRDGVWDPALLPSARRSMATFFLYMCDHTVTTRNPPGNIVIRNCRVRNAARFLRYNFGGETWQKAHPLADITFENCEATGLRLPLAANGGPADGSARPLDLTLRNCDLAFDVPVGEFVSCANVRTVRLENVEVKAASRIPVARTWSGTPDLVCRDVRGLDLSVAKGAGAYQCPAR